MPLCPVYTYKGMEERDLCAQLYYHHHYKVSGKGGQNRGFRMSPELEGRGKEMDLWRRPRTDRDKWGLSLPLPFPKESP